MSVSSTPPTPINGKNTPILRTRQIRERFKRWQRLHRWQRWPAFADPDSVGTARQARIRPRKECRQKVKGRPRGAFFGTFLRAKKVRTKSSLPAARKNCSNQGSSPPPPIPPKFPTLANDVFHLSTFIFLLPHVVRTDRSQLENHPPGSVRAAVLPGAGGLSQE